MKKAVELFMETSFFERALDVIEDLIHYYKTIDPDYEELSKVYMLRSKCYLEITTNERTVLNRFYGVKFFGKKFDDYFRNKLFVYRRGGFYMSDQVMKELKDKFPEAKVVPKPPTDDELKDPDIYYIYVFNMKPRDVVGFDCY